MGIIGSLFNSIKGFFSDAFSILLTFLKFLGSWILDGIAFLLRPLFDLISAIFYLFYKLGLLSIEVLQIVLAVARLLMGLMVGGARTIMSLSFDGGQADLGGMAESFAVLQPFIQSMKLDVFAGIAMFGIWIFTFFAAQRIIGNFK